MIASFARMKTIFLSNFVNFAWLPICWRPSPFYKIVGRQFFWRPNTHVVLFAFVSQYALRDIIDSSFAVFLSFFFAYTRS